MGTFVPDNFAHKSRRVREIGDRQPENQLLLSLKYVERLEDSPINGRDSYDHVKRTKQPR